MVCQKVNKNPYKRMKAYVTEEEKDSEQVDQSETPYERVGRF